MPCAFGPKPIQEKTRYGQHEERGEKGSPGNVLAIRPSWPSTGLRVHLPREILGDFEEFSKQPIEQFPFEQNVFNKLDVWMQTCRQKQGNRSFDGYTESARLPYAQVGME
ncbi:hypothetical protein N7491_004631 [Penicillium cf. griseofulvum]|uniref:Uncharacterized protein n=1 Tax=Penicillium cf. griseofulvum TaxID=2972120 RepID=A0A9W9J276_9EURO|nr:hypothetical protein N7472_007321 [Penicillium cf. griseofulvum]KAJ5434036.1 hypothetical protein N7491_004631 [Penicillium cf. griseofulvum]KAJ5451868.1 hypothetical protein N7445_000051 [Penicillium cf. griseofulvum]